MFFSDRKAGWGAHTARHYPVPSEVSTHPSLTFSTHCTFIHATLFTRNVQYTVHFFYTSPPFLGNNGSSSPSGLGLICQMVYTKNVAIEIHTADGAMRYPALCDTL